MTDVSVPPAVASMQTRDEKMRELEREAGILKGKKGVDPASVRSTAQSSSGMTSSNVGEKQQRFHFSDKVNLKKDEWTDVSDTLSKAVASTMLGPTPLEHERVKRRAPILASRRLARMKAKGKPGFLERYVEKKMMTRVESMVDEMWEREMCKQVAEGISTKFDWTNDIKQLEVEQRKGKFKGQDETDNAMQRIQAKFETLVEEALARKIVESAEDYDAYHTRVGQPGIDQTHVDRAHKLKDNVEKGLVKSRELATGEDPTPLDDIVFYAIDRFLDMLDERTSSKFISENPELDNGDPEDRVNRAGRIVQKFIEDAERRIDEEYYAKQAQSHPFNAPTTTTEQYSGLTERSGRGELGQESRITGEGVRIPITRRGETQDTLYFDNTRTGTVGTTGTGVGSGLTSGASGIGVSGTSGLNEPLLGGSSSQQRTLSGKEYGFPGTEGGMGSGMGMGRPSRDLPPPVRARLMTEQVIRRLEERSREYTEDAKQRTELRKQRVHPELREKGNVEAEIAKKWSMQETARLFERVKAKDQILHGGASTVPAAEQRTSSRKDIGAGVTSSSETRRPAAV